MVRRARRAARAAAAGSRNSRPRSSASMTARHSSRSSTSLRQRGESAFASCRVARTVRAASRRNRAPAASAKPPRPGSRCVALDRHRTTRPPIRYSAPESYGRPRRPPAGRCTMRSALSAARALGADPTILQRRPRRGLGVEQFFDAREHRGENLRLRQIGDAESIAIRHVEAHARARPARACSPAVRAQMPDRRSPAARRCAPRRRRTSAPIGRASCRYLLRATPSRIVCRDSYSRPPGRVSSRML